MNNYILAHDLGTSGNKAVLYNFDGQLCDSVTYEYPTYYPKDSYVEQDPEDWWKAVCLSTKELIEKTGIKKEDIACVSFSGIMMGCLPVDREGNPLRRMIIWADTRSNKQAAFMERELGLESAYQIIGHRISSSYSASKLLWIKDNEPELYKKTYKVLQAKDYIAYKLTGKFVTDYSDACGTNLFDIKAKKWSDDIIKALGISNGILPEAHRSTDIIGKVTPQAAAHAGLAEGTPVVIGGGDGSCATVGAGVVEEGKTYNVIGTSSWISCASSVPVFDKQMRSFNWIHLDGDLYAPCGTMQAAGNSLRWLKSVFYQESEAEAKKKGVNIYSLIDDEVSLSPPGANNLVFLPYLLGERSPRWNPDASGAFVGMKMNTTKADISRAVLEGVGFNLKIILDILNENIPVDDIIVIGGGARSQIWLRILSDIWQKPLLVPEYLNEATSIGAAMCGGIGVGAFKNFKSVSKFNVIKERIVPNSEYKDVYDRLFHIFDRTYEQLVPIYEEMAND